MVADVLIADELLAEALDWPRDPRSVADALNRPAPDPFESFTAEFLKWAETFPLRED